MREADDILGDFFGDHRMVRSHFWDAGGIHFKATVEGIIQLYKPMTRDTAASMIRDVFGGSVRLASIKTREKLSIGLDRFFRVSEEPAATPEEAEMLMYKFT